MNQDRMTIGWTVEATLTHGSGESARKERKRFGRLFTVKSAAEHMRQLARDAGYEAEVVTQYKGDKLPW